MQGVSDLHVWALKPGIPLLAAHVVLAEGADGGAVLDAATSYCRSAGIECALDSSPGYRRMNKDLSLVQGLLTPHTAAGGSRRTLRVSGYNSKLINIAFCHTLSQSMATVCACERRHSTIQIDKSGHGHACQTQIAAPRETL